MDTHSSALNQVYSPLSAQRRYEVWFLRLGLADNSGAWWLRYLLLNPGRHGCVGNPLGIPVQVWATWFPARDKPQSFIQGFPLATLELSDRRSAPFRFAVAENAIEETSCRGHLDVDGHEVSWSLHYASTFGTTLSDKGWIGFSRTTHSDAEFSGSITLDGRRFEGQPIGFGLQGHNCGYRHRNFWRWTHAYFPCNGRAPTTLEGLVYEMPFGFVFRRGVLWHDGRQYRFKLREISLNRDEPQWNWRASTPDGLQLEVNVDGRGAGVHRLPYLKTDCSGSFEVVNNSYANATLKLKWPSQFAETIETRGGAVLEMGGVPH